MSGTSDGARREGGLRGTDAPPMISYAQNAEDVVLDRLFGSQMTGFYIDVGASDPVEDSVTKHFYDLGWHGINVEPDPRQFAKLAAARPRDTNVQFAVSDRRSTATFYLGGEEAIGLSTLLYEQAAESLGNDVQEIEIETRTLAELCEHYEVGIIDFLKVDVEGAEPEVLRGCDWRRFRPRVVVVEATAPRTARPVHEQWEPMLREAGYRCVLFDGLNRFYAATDDHRAAALLSAPANVSDHYRRVDFARALERVAELDRQSARTLALARELEARLLTAQATQRELERRLARERPASGDAESGHGAALRSQCRRDEPNRPEQPHAERAR